MAEDCHLILCDRCPLWALSGLLALKFERPLLLYSVDLKKIHSQCENLARNAFAERSSASISAIFR
jgi:hypothetical protein